MSTATISHPHKAKRIHRPFSFLVLVAAALVIILPLLITVFASFKTLAQIGVEFPL